MDGTIIGAEQLKSLSAAATRKYNARFGGAVAQLKLSREQLEAYVRTARAHDGDHGADHRDRQGEGRQQVRRRFVGGMSLMLVIGQTLKERFGLQARLQDPHLAVAEGAAPSRYAEGQGEHAGRGGELTANQQAAEAADQLGQR